MKRKIMLTAMICALIACTVFVSFGAVYKNGSRGDVVKTIQTRLKSWGYYSGSVDGIYGPKTVAAVKAFQQKNGLAVDGICGPATLRAIGIYEPSSQDSDLYLLARIISAEARGEPYIGQVAVGAVVLNRVRHPSFPDTVAGVIYQKGAFSAISDGQWNAAVTQSAWDAARAAKSGWDPTGGAIYYYNPRKTTSRWIYSRPVVLTIGDHVFAR